LATGEGLSFPDHAAVAVAVAAAAAAAAASWIAERLSPNRGGAAQWVEAAAAAAPVAAGAPWLAAPAVRLMRHRQQDGACV